MTWREDDLAQKMTWRENDLAETSVEKQCGGEC
jgi:hypothetical protein